MSDSTKHEVITLSFPKEWIEDLKLLAIEKSNETKVIHSHLDLIRLSLIEKYNLNNSKFVTKYPKVYGKEINIGSDSEPKPKIKVRKKNNY